MEDSLAVGQRWDGDERVILFIKPAAKCDLNKELEDNIRDALRTRCSPRHVPRKIIAVEDIPYTINGKKVELAVKQIIHGEEPRNRDALANPESLEQFRNLAELRS